MPPDLPNLYDHATMPDAMVDNLRSMIDSLKRALSPEGLPLVGADGKITSIFGTDISPNEGTRHDMNLPTLMMRYGGIFIGMNCIKHGRLAIILRIPIDRPDKVLSELVSIDGLSVKALA